MATLAATILRMMTDAEEQVYLHRDTVAFMHRSRQRVLEELAVVDAEIAQAEAELCEAEARLLRSGAVDPDGPVVIQAG